MKNIKKFALLAFVMLTGMNGLEAKKAGTITNKSIYRVDISYYFPENTGTQPASINIGSSRSNTYGAVAVSALVPTLTGIVNSSTLLAKTPIGYDGSYLIKDSIDSAGHPSLILTFTDGTTIVPPLS